MATVLTVLLDIIPFLGLAVVVLLGFSLASFSLNHQESDHLLHTVQSLFYALLGDFDHYVSNLDPTLQSLILLYALAQQRCNGEPR